MQIDEIFSFCRLSLFFTVHHFLCFSNQNEIYFWSKKKNFMLVVNEELINFCKQLENELTGLNRNCVSFALKNDDYEGIISCFGQQAIDCPKEFEKMLTEETLKRLKIFYSNIK